MRRPRGRLLDATAVVALVGVLVALVGLAVVARPLRTPTQDCGTALTYLMSGKVDVYVDPDDPPAGVTRAEALANNADPCQERAGDRALPALVLVVGGTLVALVALVVEVVARVRRHRADVRARAGLTPGRPPRR